MGRKAKARVPEKWNVCSDFVDPLADTFKVFSQFQFEPDVNSPANFDAAKLIKEVVAAFGKVIEFAGTENFRKGRQNYTAEFEEKTDLVLVSDEAMKECDAVLRMIQHCENLWKTWPHDELFSSVKPSSLGEFIVSSGVPDKTLLAVRRCRDAYYTAVAISKKLNRELFIPNELQQIILTTLDGSAMTAENLLANLNIGSKETLFGKRNKGGLKELVDLGFVKNERRLGGYYRPDAPPE